ncbi:protein HslO [Gracilibacillus halophilus YIM-C55.5]|uniref:Protein HslO n=1 Tax=Gracilibacillus halophilus YIM-C55.5 TaxID=1308866 RepID=N4WPY7_9BACI|nr:Hsp33 family molecular chaperone HslO [Gracilibacillus halophilus]ENH98192.1 protein HslO [Gracilibacillus halophilus YIM-C55.5]
MRRNRKGLMQSFIILSGSNSNIVDLKEVNNTSQNDYIIRGSALDGKVLVIGADNKSSLESIRKSNGTTLNASVALGRTLSIAAMMSSMQKNGVSTNIHIKCDGPIEGITVKANSKGKVQGYVENPNVNLILDNDGKFELSPIIGKGNIEVIMTQKNGEIVKKDSPIVSGEIGEDFSYYFSEVQGIPSAVAVGELIDTDESIMVSGGFIIQILEPLTDKNVKELENRLNQMEPLSTQISKGKTIHEILENIVGPVKVLERKEITN